MIFFFSNFYRVRFQNRAKSGNLGKVARFAIRVKPGIVLIKFVLYGDPLYFLKSSMIFPKMILIPASAGECMVSWFGKTARFSILI